MYILIAEVRVKRECSEDFIRAIVDVTRATCEREPGSLIRFDLIRDASEPDRFFAYEVWRDAAAFAAHQQADHYRRFGETTGAWLAEPPVVHCAGTNAYPPGDDTAWRQEGRMDPVEPMGIRFADDSLPAGYDRIFTPRLFEPWTHVLVDCAGIRTGDAVLDVATGPGTVARLAAARAAGSGRVAGIDISAPMLALARQKAPPPGAAPLEFRQAPADALPFAAATFDVVLCQQGLQFFPDPVAALREMHRVLKPGGRVGLAVWAKGYARDIDRVLSDCLEQAGGHRPPFPTFGTHPDDLPAALAQAGFGSIRCAEHTLELPFPSGIEHVLDSLGASPLRHELIALTPAAAARFRACAERQLQAFITGGALRTRSVARLATAIAS